MSPTLCGLAAPGQRLGPGPLSTGSIEVAGMQLLERGGEAAQARKEERLFPWSEFPGSPGLPSLLLSFLLNKKSLHDEKGEFRRPLLCDEQIRFL